MATRLSYVHEVGQRFEDRLARIDWTIADSNRRAAVVITHDRRI